MKPANNKIKNVEQEQAAIQLKAVCFLILQIAKFYCQKNVDNKTWHVVLVLTSKLGV